MTVLEAEGLLYGQQQGRFRLLCCQFCPRHISGKSVQRRADRLVLRSAQSKAALPKLPEGFHSWYQLNYCFLESKTLKLHAAGTGAKQTYWALAATADSSVCRWNHYQRNSHWQLWVLYLLFFFIYIKKETALIVLYFPKAQQVLSPKQHSAFL